jgi:hypothetical protein
MASTAVTRDHGTSAACSSRRASKNPSNPRRLHSSRPSQQAPKWRMRSSRTLFTSTRATCGSSVGGSTCAGNSFNCLRLALLVEDFHRLQSARLCRTVQFAQVAPCLLSRTIGSADGFDQRPICMLLAIFAPPVRPQKHSGRILSCEPRGFKRVGLHYIDFLESAIARKDICPARKRKIAQITEARDELRLVLTQC